MRKSGRIKIIFLSMSISFLLLAPMVSSLNIYQTKEPEFDSGSYSSIIEVDIKVKTSSGSWKDDSITADVGKTLEFKITASFKANREYWPGGVAVSLPTVSNKPMFELDEESLELIKGGTTGLIVLKDDKKVSWSWVPLSTPCELEMKFKAKIKKAASSQRVKALACGDVYDQNGNYIGCEEEDDYVKVTGQGGSCCFPAGTKITMADGSVKNIEDVKASDWVLSFDVKTGLFTSWMVKMTGYPVHPVISINNGLIETTVDHPVYVKKQNGQKGWAAYDPERSKDAITYFGNIYQLEITDKLLTKEQKWVEIETISLPGDSVQTYNILSFSGMRTYFANGILVYEEHPTFSMIKYILDSFINKIESSMGSNPLLKSLLKL
jgi:hypothetical protein